MASGAATHLRQSLCDATGTLDSKWQALEGSTTGAMTGLFHAARDSAAALGEQELSPAATRAWQQESAAQVAHEEDALRAAVFAQVYAELRSKDGRPGSSGYRAAY